MTEFNSSITASPSAPSTFLILSLPAEIRQCIYKTALTRPHPLGFASHHPMPTLGVNLLRACKQIYAEAHALVYTHNAFELWPQDSFDDQGFLCALAEFPANAALVRDLRIVLNLRMFHHSDYILWPAEHDEIMWDLEALRIQIRAVREKKGLTNEERSSAIAGDDYEEEDDEDDQDDEDESYTYEIGEAMWRALEYMHTTMVGSDDDGIEWFKDHQDVISWVDGGDREIAEAIAWYKRPDGEDEKEDEGSEEEHTHDT